MIFEYLRVVPCSLNKVFTLIMRARHIDAEAIKRFSVLVLELKHNNVDT